MIVWSVASFFIGVLVTLAIVTLCGGLTFAGIKLILQNRAAFEHAHLFAEEICVAQAVLFDKIGYPETAGMLVLFASNGTSDPTQFFLAKNQDKERIFKKYEDFLFEGNLKFPRPDVMVCGIHGESLWEEHYECLRCKRVFTDDNAPEICLCGYRLFPHPKNPLNIAAAGKTICKHCYKDRVKNNDDKPILPPKEDIRLAAVPPILTWGECPECQAVAYLQYGPSSPRTLLRYAITECPVCGHKEVEDEENASNGALADGEAL